MTTGELERRTVFFEPACGMRKLLPVDSTVLPENPSHRWILYSREVEIYCTLGSKGYLFVDCRLE
jgi:hypothetical protein